MNSKFISTLLVATQFLCLILLALTGPIVVRTILQPLEILAFLIGMWGILGMRRSRLNVFPEVLEGSQLVSSGIYKFIRHPMYLSLILLSAVLLINYFRINRLIITILLVVDLLIKIEWEERILKKEFTNYNQYIKSTWKLIPYVY